MKYKSTEQVLKIIKNKDQIRNFGVIAHVDHGKTTMSDSLLAHSGIIAPRVYNVYFGYMRIYLLSHSSSLNKGTPATLFMKTLCVIARIISACFFPFLVCNRPFRIE